MRIITIARKAKGLIFGISITKLPFPRSMLAR